MAGRLVYFEVPADDTQRAKDFYAELFGWQFRPMQEGFDYHMLEDGIEPGGAIYPSETGEKGAIIYFESDDVDASVERVSELGGSAEDKQPIPGVGWFARCEDTEGNPFSIFQPDESVPIPAEMQGREISN
ncbi:MAG: VOC family protein [Actinobacteria bacterium]|nr:VOC family protein [Actinomycetota bacterium]